MLRLLKEDAFTFPVASHHIPMSRYHSLSVIHSTDAIVSLATCESSEGSLKASTLACHKSNFKFMAERAN